MTNRERLVEELKQNFLSSSIIRNSLKVEDLADFILEDRRRILEPILQVLYQTRASQPFSVQFNWPEWVKEAIDKTLNLAGLGDDNGQ